MRVVSPAGVLAGDGDNQGFRGSIEGRSARIGARFGAVELACDETTVPGQDRVGLGDAREILQDLASESFGDLGQSGSFRIRQPEPRRQVSCQDAILGRQILVAQQQLLID